MNSKCRFCGYRFQSSDEMICPECLTAREEDISCGVYGDDNHSHDLDPFSKGFDIDGTDMYKEKKNDFIAKERKEEAADPNFRSPVYRKAPQQNYRQPYNRSSVPQNRQPYNFNATQQNNAFRQLPPNFPQGFQNAGFNNQQQKPKQTSSGCVIAVIMLVIIMFGFVAGVENSYDAKDYFPDSRPTGSIAQTNE